MATIVLTTTDPGGGGSANNTNVKFYITTSNFSGAVPAQRVTVLQCPASNTAFNRSCQLSSEYVFIKRGTSTFAIPVVDLAGIAVTQIPALSYSPLITVQPVSASVSAGNTANFNVSANSESTLSYEWAANNGTAWVTNISNTTNNCNGVFSLISSSILSATPATNVPNSFSLLCHVINATGNINTRTVTLTVT
jgi:hypothetical protein